eukprot:15144082-Ditylum_brightwellii.AAC.1
MGLLAVDMDWMDWNSLGKALDLQTLFNQVHRANFMHDWLHTGTQCATLYENAVEMCPMCGTTTETQLH